DVAEGALDEILLLRDVPLVRPRGGARGRGPPGERDLPVEVEGALQDEGPRAHVLRLLLHPHEVRASQALEVPPQRLARERVELFEAGDRDVLPVVLAAVVLELVTDLPAGDEQPPDGAGVDR